MKSSILVLLAIMLANRCSAQDYIVTQNYIIINNDTIPVVKYIPKEPSRHFTVIEFGRKGDYSRFHSESLRFKQGQNQMDLSSADSVFIIYTETGNLIRAEAIHKKLKILATDFLIKQIRYDTTQVFNTDMQLHYLEIYKVYESDIISMIIHENEAYKKFHYLFARFNKYFRKSL